MLAGMEVARLIEPERVVKLRRAVFEEMIERGLLPEDDRIQLLEGVLVQRSPQGDAHAREIVKLTNVLGRRIGDRADIAPQVPFRAGDYSRPEPDLALWPLAEDGAPPPERPLLVIEVAVSSLRDDRLVMAPIYATAGVPEYWIVNLVDSVIERHTEPQGERYTRIEPLRPGQVVRLVALPDVDLAVADLLPRI
jgi:Uma2 family endonuclease